MASFTKERLEFRRRRCLGYGRYLSYFLVNTHTRAPKHDNFLSLLCIFSLSPKKKTRPEKSLRGETLSPSSANVYICKTFLPPNEYFRLAAARHKIYAVQYCMCMDFGEREREELSTH